MGEHDSAGRVTEPEVLRRGDSHGFGRLVDAHWGSMERLARLPAGVLAHRPRDEDLFAAESIAQSQWLATRLGLG
jgi:hypothetical protein